MNMKRPELLAPAGNMEKLEVAVAYGADAVYLGGPNYGLRMRADNFSPAELPAALEFAHRHGVKVYVTMNIFAHGRDFHGMGEYINLLRDSGVDGVIVADPGIMRVIRREAPGLKIHLSTQANTTNASAAAFWEEQGVSRIVLARELSLEEIRDIRQKVRAELEVFVHGAMCISYSGRCLLSRYMTGRDANLGDCAQACRWRYFLQEEKRPGQYFPVFEDERGTYILNSRDLCLVKYLPALADAGVDSFKIEGRVKSAHYVATVVKVYREAIDRLMEDPAGYKTDPRWWDELRKVSNREYTTGFVNEDGGGPEHGGTENIYRREWSFVGMVKNYDPVAKMIEVEQRNRFFRGETLEILSPGEPARNLLITQMFDQDGKPVDSAPHPCQRLFIPSREQVEPYSILRRENS